MTARMTTTQRMLVNLSVGWDTCVVATPAALKFMDCDKIAKVSGRAIRYDYKQPDEPERSLIKFRQSGLILAGCSLLGMSERPARGTTTGRRARQQSGGPSCMSSRPARPAR